MPFFLMLIMSCLWNTQFLAFYDEKILCGLVYMATLGRQTFIMFFAVQWRDFGQVQINKTNSEWVYCPVCGNKTHTMIQEDAEMKNFPLYCPKGKQETIINVQNKAALRAKLARSQIKLM